MAPTGTVLPTSEAKVHEVLRSLQLRDPIDQAEVRFGLDMTDDPAMYIVFQVKKEAVIWRHGLEDLTRFKTSVTAAILATGIAEFPYTRLRQAA